MYFFTSAGVLLSKYMPMFKATIINGWSKDLVLPYKTEIIAAFAIGLMVTYFMEKGGDKEGKRKNFGRRAVSHLANGTLWHTLIGG